MHELSIAVALVGQALRHRPAGAVVLCVRVEAGALQAIDPEAMRWAWRAATEETPLVNSVIDVHCEPWQIDCAACGRRWTGDDPLESCACGSADTQPHGDDRLRLLSLEVMDDHACARD